MQVTTPWQAVENPAWWRQNLAWGIGLLAVILAGSALVSWVAANWPHMVPQTRLLLVQGGLALTVLLAAVLAWRGSRWAGLLTGVAALGTGGLLALVGQIYQTGADSWQLFLAWAALITPWLLLMRGALLALLWVALLNLGLWLYADQGVAPGLWFWTDDGSGSVSLVLVNAVLVLGLGCENNQVSALKEVIGQWDDERVKFLVAQEVEDEIEAGFEICCRLVEKTKADKRQPLPLAYLKVGLKCGGSDGFSGITANPLVGLFSDWLIAQGGTTVLTEVPEMFGAETILMDRAADRRVFDGTVSLINDFKRYFRRFDQPIYENPSPGNKKGGITTLEEKSLGCVQKGGAQPVVDVLTYAQPVTKPGLNLLQAPGNDLVAASALALSGCQLVLFTTGRGTPFGSFVPTMKISTNTQLAEFKANWIDFNAGTLVEDEEPQAVLERFIGKVLATAGGERLKHEETGFKEIAIFKTGVTL